MKNAILFSSFLVLGILASPVRANTTTTMKDGIRGAVVGGIVGAVVGNNSKMKDSGKGAAIGAAGGFILGSVVGETKTQRRDRNAYQTYPASGSPVVVVQQGSVHYPSTVGSSNPNARRLAMDELARANDQLAWASRALEQALAQYQLAEAKVRAAELTLQQLQ